MKAALVQPDGSLKVAECPTPEPGPGDLVVKVAYSGICGTDIHTLETGALPAGCIIGHELSGTIAAVSEAVEGWCEGDPVVVLPIDPCFTCEPCRAVDHAMKPASWVTPLKDPHRLPGGVSHA